MSDLTTVLEILRPYASIIGIVSAIIGLLSVIIGFVVKHFSDRRQRAYDAQLAFVRDQLKELYGPLFLLSEAGNRAWATFRQKFRPDTRISDSSNPLTPDERTEYVRWLEAVFVPCNEKMRSTIEANAHLFVEGQAPGVVLDMLVHFDTLSIVLSKLKDGSDSNVITAVAYPKDFETYIRKDYEQIVTRHALLTAGKTVALAP